MTRVQTGCSNCKRCTNSAVGEGGRKTGRALAAMATLGASEGARLTTSNCRTCGHKMSLHTNSTAARDGRYTTDGVDPLAIPDTVSNEMLEQRLAESTHALERLNAKIASLEAKGKTRTADRHRGHLAELLENQQRYADALEARRRPAQPAPAQGSSHPPTTAAVTAPAADANDLPAQLARLADMHAQGVLSDDEFTAAKARLLT